MKRILIVKLWALGDILMATPLLTALKSRWPGCALTWLADTECAGLLEGNPLLEEVIAFDSGAWRRDFRYGRLAPYLRRSLGLRRALRRRRFDAVINLTAEKWWGVWFAVAPVRIGLFPGERIGPVGRLYTEAIPRARRPLRHNTEHYLQPAQALGIPGPYDERMVLVVPPPDQEAARRFLREQPGYDPSRPLIVLHPGTSQETKSWPVESFAAVAARLQERATVVITGSDRERALAESILAALPARTGQVLVAAGRLTNIQQTAALVQRAAAVVTGDTSVLHIASALGTPVVGIYGSTRPGDYAPRFGPNRLLYDDRVPCAPCYQAQCPLTGDDHRRCLRAITPQAVLEAVDSLRGAVESVGAGPR